MMLEGKTFKDSEFGNNGYDFLRYLWASFTILAHFTWKFGEYPIAAAPLLNKITAATLYFNPLIALLSISGFLIAASLENSKSLKEFFTKRILRLYPEFWMSAVVTLVSLLIVVPYLLDKSILFWLGTQIIGLANTPGLLRTYGTGVVNGSIWSVFVQIQLYVVLGLFHKYIKKLKTWQWLILLAILLGANIGCGYLIGRVDDFVVKVIGKIFVPFAIWFFTGAFVYYKRDRMIPLLKKAFFPLLVVYVLAKVIGIRTPGYFDDSLFGVLLSLIIIGCGYLLPKMQFRVDLTYGMFLYHWPVLNILIHYDLMNKLHWGWSLLILVVATLALAFLSWMFVRQPSKKIIDNLMMKMEKQAT